MNIGGFIGSSGLIDWWLSNFSNLERIHIVDTFRPMGKDPSLGSILVDGPIHKFDKDRAGFLATVGSWFPKEADRTIAYRMLEYGEFLLATSDSVLSRHFFYHNKIKTYYKWREIDNFALDKAIDGCNQQIAMSSEAAKEFLKSGNLGFLPGHHGFRQLAIIETKRKDYSEALRLCIQARSEGWQDDWDTRIVKLEGRIAKGSLAVHSKKIKAS